MNYHGFCSILLFACSWIPSSQRLDFQGLCGQELHVCQYVCRLQRTAQDRGLFNVVGAALFIVFYLVLPESMYSLIGIIGGIGVGYSAGYRWQTAFNTFGALSIASALFGMPMAVALRVGINVISSVYTLVCNKIIDGIRIRNFVH